MDTTIDGQPLTLACFGDGGEDDAAIPAPDAGHIRRCALASCRAALPVDGRGRTYCDSKCQREDWRNKPYRKMRPRLGRDMPIKAANGDMLYREMNRFRRYIR